MAHDDQLAERIRALLADVSDVDERRMFGGLAFMIGGHMAVAANSRGGLLVRVDPEASAALVGSTPARPMVMQGRSMTGWLELDADDVRTARQLTPWVRRARAYVATLPPKAAAKKR